MRFRTNETNAGTQIPVLLAIGHKFVTPSRKMGTRGGTVF